MTEHKPDDLSSTGSHPVWNPALSPGVTSDSWIPPMTPPPISSRHAAITRSLKHFPNYMSWTDKIKTTWKPDGEPDKKEESKEE